MHNDTFRVYAVAVAGYKEKTGSWPKAVTTDLLEASLGSWLDNCHKQFDADILTVKQIEMVNQIAPGWYQNISLTWDLKAIALSTYLFENCEMPKKSHPLYRWFAVQSGLAKCGFLESRKIEWIQEHCLGLSDFGVKGTPLWKFS